MYRTEKDSLGEKQIPVDALYGIHALRAKENFPDNSPFPTEWYRAAGNRKAWKRTRGEASSRVHAVNLEKISSDLRLLASDISGHRTITIPEKQVGSSIMPGKINPVIPEFVISAAQKVYSNDLLTTSLCGQGALELNAYLPVIGASVIESLKLLISCDKTLHVNLLEGLKVNETAGYEALMHSPSVTTALTPHIGYYKASELAKQMKEKKIDIFEANSILKAIDPSKLETILRPGNLLKLGFLLDDLENK